MMEAAWAERLAAWLEADGCTDVSVLDGGTHAWAAAGNVLFSGVNVTLQSVRRMGRASLRYRER